MFNIIYLLVCFVVGDRVSLALAILEESSVVQAGLNVEIKYTILVENLLWRVVVVSEVSSLLPRTVSTVGNL